MRGGLRIGIFIGIAAMIGSAASCTSADDAEPRRWECYQSGSSCDCFALGPDEGVYASGTLVDACSGYSCCLLAEPAAHGDAHCECLDLAGDCQAEAASRKATTVVAECPPPSEQVPSACAAAAENCREDYLQQQGLDGCCKELLCKNQGGIPLCSAATAEELALHAECKKSGINARPTIIQELKTNEGTLSFDDVTVRPVHYGPGGCLVSLEVAFHGSCTLRLVAGPARDAEGRLIVTEDIGCVWLAGPVTGTLDFDGVSCVAEGRCFSGTLDFRLTSPPPSGGPVPDQQLTGDPFVLQGSFCDFGNSVDSCP